MTDTVRMKVTVTFEYDALLTPDFYPTSDSVAAAAIDRDAFLDDVGRLMDAINNTEFTLTVEPMQ